MRQPDASRLSKPWEPLTITHSISWETCIRRMEDCCMEPQQTEPALQPSIHLAAYKALCDQLKHDESIFWTRFQSYLFVTAALAALLVGMLGLLSRPQPLGQQPSVPVGAIYLSAILVCGIGL